MKTLANMLQNFCIAALILISPTSKGSSQDTAMSLSLKIDQLLTSYHNLNRLNGVVLVAQDGETILSKGYGSASIEWNIPNAPEVKYLIGSITKPFTATLIMQLIDQGKLRLDTRLSDLLPWYRRDVAEKVTVFQLLNHTSGIPNYLDLKSRSMDGLTLEFGTAVVDKIEFARNFCSADLLFDPGTKWAYNNSAYFLLALIVEQVTKKPFHVALSEMIFQPLQMAGSGDLQPNPEQVVEKLATGYVKTPDGFNHMHYWNFSTALGAGSIYATTGDLLKFDQALNSGSFLSAKAKEAMFTPGLNGYGCGWELREVPLGKNSEIRKIQTHEGFVRAWHARYYRIPEDGYCIVIFSNAGDSPLEKMFSGITDVLYGRIPVFPKPSLREAVGKKYKTDGIDQAIEYGKSLVEADFNAWETQENELNSMGYQLLNSGLRDEAVKIFQWNTELHPQSWNVWDSYGEGLAKAGKKQSAIEAYQKSIKLNPENYGGTEMLKKLQAD